MNASSTSRSLLARIRANDSVAWTRLVQLYAPLVCYWCRQARLPEHDLADVTQEVFKAVASHVAGFQTLEQRGSFRGWLRVITRNKVHDYYRRREREPRAIGGSEAHLQLVALPVAELASSDGSEEKAHRRLFRQALAAIQAEFEDRTWQAFWRVVVDDRPVSDVAAELGMRPGTVRVCKSRVLHRLRQELGDLWQ
ncbi:MAG: RNA polymerase sigma factor [Planctomycetota bacterium]